MIYELAGFVGIDPDPLTLRELAWMARGRASRLWDHTASLLAMTANVHRDPKRSRTHRPVDFHPFEKRRRGGMSPAALRKLKPLFVKQE